MTTHVCIIELVHGEHYLSLCFFFSSRRRHTILVSDWSSDVCSSDLRFSPVIYLHRTGNRLNGLTFLSPTQSHRAKAAVLKRVGRIVNATKHLIHHPGGARCGFTVGGTPATPIQLVTNGLDHWLFDGERS